MVQHFRSHRWLQAFLIVFVLVTAFSMTRFFASADTTVVTGTVKYPDGTGAPSVSVELHLSDGAESYTATTDTGGNFSFSQALTATKQYTVEVHNPPTGYNKPTNSPYLFTYQSGDASRTVDFTLVAANKVVSGKVTDADGTLVTDADIGATPVDGNTNPSASTRTDTTGSFTLNLASGSYFIQASANLSEQNVRWIMEDKPVRVDFKSDQTAETSTVNFTATPATGQLKVVLLNSDGSKLTTNNFVADISVFRVDGVGTIRKVNSADSSLAIWLTPGIYSLTAFHQDLQGKSFAIDPFVITDGGVTDLGTVTASVNSAHLKGTVKDTKGKGISGIQVQAIRDGGPERPTATTDATGTYDLVVGAGTWTVGPNFGPGSTGLKYSQAAPVVATVKNGTTVTGLDLIFTTLDRTITGTVKKGGTTLTDFVGTVYARTPDKKNRVSATVVDGAFTLQYSSTDFTGAKVIIGAEADPTSPYAGKSEVQVTNSGTTAKDITVVSYDAAMAGSVLANGTAITGSDITISAVDTVGNFTTTSVASNGTYSLPLAAGTWTYSVTTSTDDQENGYVDRPADENTVTIGAGKTVTKNISITKGTNTISGTVTDSSGTAVKRALVVVDNSANVETTSNDDSKIIRMTAETDEAGTYSIKVPDGTYLVKVGDTPAVGSTQIQPDAKTVKISGSSSATANLKFEASDTTLKGQVKLNGKADKDASVTAWTDDGGQVKTTTDASGNYSLPVTSKEVWHVIVTDINGKTLAASDQADITTKAGTVSKNLTLTDSGEKVPGPVKATFKADEGGVVSTPDGMSVSVPPFAIDLAGTVTLTVTPKVDGDPTAGGIPAGLTYDVTATDSTGREVKALNKAASISIPFPDKAVEEKGLSTDTLSTDYFNPDTKQWEHSAGIVKNGMATMTSTHLTKFSVSGAAKAKPKVTKFTVKSSDTKNMTVEITGQNFSGKVSVKVGSVKATKVVVKNSTTLTVTVPVSTLKAGTYTLTITNGNGRTVTKEKAVTLKKKGSTLTTASVKVAPSPLRYVR